jgi:hypothetical protein
MNTGNHIVDQNLARAASKWRGLRFLQRTGLIGSLLCLAFLLLALAMLRGWITEPGTATALVVGAVFLAGVCWLGAGVVVLGSEPDTRMVANAVERGQPRLLDRVHALVALQPVRRKRALGAAFYARIARQAQTLLVKAPPTISMPSARAKLHLLAFVVLLTGTALLYHTLSPWQRMIEARQARMTLPGQKTAPPPEAGLELAAPTNSVREKLPWGEIRITDPARDLQVTKVDVVPMQIEAAANEAIEKVGWASAINGQGEQGHDLPSPPDPKYAVYQPTLYLDELKLSDWDVLSYYARASTRASNAFASEVYFLEVRPFREDILKIPGGENGKAMQCINELSSLISQQQHVIRQTHQHAQNPPESEKMQEQDRKKLAEAETDLGKATEHLYARMASELENTPIGDALDHLALAEKELEAASGSLRRSALPEGQKQERGALADLVAARKAFQRAVSDHPDDFKEKPLDDTDPATGAQDRLKEIAEFRNEAKAAQYFMKKLLEQQQQLAEKARPTNATTRSQYPKFAEEERQIQNGLEQFRQQHPQVFKPAQGEADAAKQSMQQAAQSLERKDSGAGKQVRQAAEKMEQLAGALREKSAERSLADAYKLRQMLERQIEKFGQCQNPGAGGGPSGAEVKQAVGDTRQALKELKNLAEQSPTKEAFGPELRESLNQGNQMALNWSLGELEQAATAEARKQPAGEAKEGLQKVTKAFERSEPKSLQAAEKAGRSGPEESFERGLAELGSLIKQIEKKVPLSRQDQARLGREALQNLQCGLPGKGGSNERGEQILLELEKELKQGEKPVDVEILKSVLDTLQAFSVEVVSKKDANLEKSQMTDVDPSRLPPAYRGRIQKYFQKLSEK